MVEPEPILRAASILVVDDDLFALNLLDELITGFSGSHVAACDSAEEAIAWCRDHTPDVVVTDYQMPGIDGLQFLTHLRSQETTREVPVMMVTALDDREIRRRALDLGANDFLSKPLDAAEVKARLRNMILVRQAQQLLANQTRELGCQVRLATSRLAGREQEIVLRLCRAAEFRDWESGEHLVRAAHYARIIARELGLTAGDQELIFLATPMHDVGKIGIPDHILLKPSRLDDSEFAFMKQHTVIGHRILGGSEAELLQIAAEIALSHHERFDGAGYPNGIRGEAIPRFGRIVAIADVFDALLSHRPYKMPWSVDAAVALVREGAGTQFDPACVTAFNRGLSEILTVVEQFKDTGPSGLAFAPTPMLGVSDSTRSPRIEIQEGRHGLVLK